MFPNLMPLQNYTISISMRNEVGSGPAAEVSVMTPPEKLGTSNPMRFKNFTKFRRLQ